jgi:hypothetical protein
MLRTVLEELLVSVEALQEPLAVVEAVHADDQPPTDKALGHVAHLAGSDGLRG